MFNQSEQHSWLSDESTTRPTIEYDTAVDDTSGFQIQIRKAKDPRVLISNRRFLINQQSKMQLITAAAAAARRTTTTQPTNIQSEAKPIKQSVPQRNDKPTKNT